jgi:hypothetical protein
MRVFPPTEEHGIKKTSDGREGLRSIAFSMDTLIPGLYIWFGSFTLRLGGSTPDDEPYRYPGMIHDFAGIGFVLPGYQIWSTYKGGYDP